MKSGKSPLVEYICSRADPWSCSACIPDGSKGTGCFSIKQMYTLATGTGGSCNFFAWTGAPQALAILDSGGANATPTIPVNWSQATQLNTMAALYGKYRIVSSGIRATYIGPTITDGGQIIFAKVNGGVPVSSFGALNITNLTSQCQSYKTYPLRNGGSVIWEPEDIEDTEFLSLLTAGVPTTNGFTTQYLICAVYGAAAAQGTIMVEAVSNLQGQFESQTFMPGGLDDTSVPTAVPGWYESAMNALSTVERITPFVGGIASAASKVPVLRSLANGFVAPYLLSRTGLPQLTYPG